MNNAINWARRFDPNRIKVNTNTLPRSNGKTNHVVILYMNNNTHAQIILPNNRTKAASFGSGHTRSNLRGKGYGRVLRALATKVAQKAKYKKVLHLSHSNVGKSKRIMRELLGYRQNGPYTNWSLFEFNKNSMNKINGILTNWKNPNATLPKPSSKRA